MPGSAWLQRVTQTSEWPGATRGWTGARVVTVSPALVSSPGLPEPVGPRCALGTRSAPCPELRSGSPPHPHPRASLARLPASVWDLFSLSSDGNRTSMIPLKNNKIRAVTSSLPVTAAPPFSSPVKNWSHDPEPDHQPTAHISAREGSAVAPPPPTASPTPFWQKTWGGKLEWVESLPLRDLWAHLCAWKNLVHFR